MIVFQPVCTQFGSGAEGGGIERVCGSYTMKDQKFIAGAFGEICNL